MAKIMLVEDDNNLREIYEARLLAEGYEIVSAHDGEEALALAVKEKPDLIISDVMMPKISGFDMLDILRSTPETKNTKVIMMTALSQAEDKSRADKLGADRYLVKSQVTLEDVAKIAREVLEDSGATMPATADPAPTAAPAATPVPDAAVTPAPAPTPTAAPMPAPAADPTVIASPVVAPPADPAPVSDPAAVTPVTADPAATPDPVAAPVPTPDDASQTATSASAEQASVNAQVDSFVAQAPSTPEPAPSTESGTRVIAPLNDLSVKPDLNKLAEEEEKKEQAMAAGNTIAPPADPSAPEASNGQDPNLIAL
jgi:CheY-like chemotaxis protein